MTRLLAGAEDLAQHPAFTPVPALVFPASACCCSWGTSNGPESESSVVLVAAGAAAGGKGMNTGNIKALIQALPQFRDVLGRLSVHIFISR